MSGYWSAASDQKQTFRASEQSQSSNKNQQDTHQSEESWKQTLASQERPKSPKPSDLGLTTGRGSSGKFTAGNNLNGKYETAVRRWGGNPS